MLSRCFGDGVKHIHKEIAGVIVLVTWRKPSFSKKKNDADTLKRSSSGGEEETGEGRKRSQRKVQRKVKGVQIPMFHLPLILFANKSPSPLYLN